MKGIILKSNVITSATTVLTDYCGNMIYEGGTLKQILVDGGYVTLNGTTPVYHYYLQDHLGNNRVVCNASGTVEQVNHYYPFGGLFGESTNGDTQRYKSPDQEGFLLFNRWNRFLPSQLPIFYHNKFINRQR